MSMIPLGASSCACKTILRSTEQWIFNLCIRLCYGKYLKVHENCYFFNLHVVLCYTHAAVMCQIHKKLVEGELWAEVTGVTIWGHIKILPGMCQVI